MNDFTKEELIEMRDYCNWEYPSIGHSDFRQNLWLKLQSLINNYCEHKNTEMNCDGGISWVCTDCGYDFDI